MKQRDTLEFTLQAMRAPDRAGGQWPVRSADGVEARDVRERWPGRLEAVEQACEIGTLPRRVAMTDWREGSLWLFSVEEGTVRCEGRVTPEGVLEAQAKVIGEISGPPKAWAGAGDFFVITPQEGPMVFLRFTADGYTWLGPLPGVPELHVGASDEVTLSAAVEPVEFRNPVADMRGGVPAEVASEAAAAVAAAHRELADSARVSGRWIQPVKARLAVRLWDGSLYGVGAPQIVAPHGWQGAERVELPLEADASGLFTGTTGGTVSAQAFSLHVEVDSEVAPQWSGVVSAFEIWIADAQEPFSSDGAATVAFHASPSRLGVIAALRDRDALASELLAAPMVLSAVVTGESARVRRPAAGLAEPLTAPPVAMAGMRAEALLGYAGFLHLGNLSVPAPLPQPAPAPGTEEVEWQAMATLSGPGGDTYVTASGRFTGAADRLAPLQWYPDRRASVLAVTLRSSAGVYSGEFQLLSAPCGEDAAYWVAPRLDAWQLSAGPASMVSPEAGGGITAEMPRALISSARGNPLVGRAKTGDVGGEVLLIEAQRTGGGAYTRQFIYAFTPDGVMALTHDVAGKHTNCRCISEACVGSRSRVAGFDGGVAALSDGGSLMVIADARVAKRVRGLPCSLAWRESSDELLVGLEGGDFALRGMGAEEMSERTEAGSEWLHQGPVPLRTDSRRRTLYLASFGSSVRLPVTWQSRWEESGLRGAAVCEVRICDSVAATVVLEMETPSGAAEALRFSVSGRGEVTARRALMLPSERGIRPRLRVRVEGCCRELAAVRVMEVDFPQR